MEPQNFETALRASARRRPFQSYIVRFVDGESNIIDHPEALILRGGLAVYVSATGQPTLFDHRNVSQLTHTVDAT